MAGGRLLGKRRIFCVAGSVIGLAVCLALLGENAIAASEQVLRLNNKENSWLKSMKNT